MFPLNFYFALNLILLLLTIIYYFSRKKEHPLQKIKNAVFIFFTLMCSLFFLNLDSLIFSRDLDSIESMIFGGFSPLILFSSLMIFISSFFIAEKDIIELDTPSRYKSRKGSIKIGKIMKKKEKET